MDTEQGTETFSGYEADFEVVATDISQKVESGNEQTGAARDTSLRAAERAIDEANEIIGQMEMEVLNIPSSVRGKCNSRLRTHRQTLDTYRRQVQQMKVDGEDAVNRAALLGNGGARSYTPDGTGELEQRSRLLSGTDRLERSSQRLRDSQRIANETEEVGAGILGDLHHQREQMENTHMTLLEADGYVDKSMRTLKGMARRMITNKLLTAAIIAILILMILLALWHKFS